MSKKKNQAERNANPTRTARTVVSTFDPEAPGIAHILPPRGKKPEPWPAWLLRTFVNQDLLKADPVELRDELFINHYPNTSWWSVVDNLLYTIEREAKRVLKEYPLPFEDHLESPCFEQLSEQHFYDIFSQGRFTHRQASAIAALRGIYVIRALSNAVLAPSGGYYFSDPHHEYTYDSIAVSKLVMEMALVIVNAIRGEFLESHAPQIERGVAVNRHLHEISRKGVEKRKKQKNQMVELCRSIAEKSTRKTVRGRAIFVQDHLKNERRKRRLPSLGTIQSWIK